MFSYLSSNRLSGAIPDSIGNLVYLESLYVSLSFSSFISTTLLLTASHYFRLNSFLYPPSLQRVVFQSTEWSHPWFDREPCQTSGTVRITNNYLSHRVHFFVTPISSHLFFFTPTNWLDFFKVTSWQVLSQTQFVFSLGQTSILTEMHFHVLTLSVVAAVFRLVPRWPTNQLPQSSLLIPSLTCPY